jgi:hypothetical protein
LIYICDELQKNDNEKMIYPLLDTLIPEVKIKNTFGLNLLFVLGKIGSNDAIDLGNKLIKDNEDSKKPRALNRFVSGIASAGYYYRALKYIPDYVSSTSELQLFNQIIHCEILKKNDAGIFTHWQPVENMYKSNFRDAESNYSYSLLTDED